MRNKKPNYSTIIIIVLLILVGLIFTYMFFQNKKLDREAIKKEKEIRESKKKENKKEEKEDKETEISLDSDIIKQVEDSTSKIGSYTRYIDYDMNNINKRSLIDTALNGLSDEQITFCISQRTQIKATISIDDLNTSLNKYVPDVKLTINDLIANKGETSLRINDYGYGDYSLVIDGDDIHVIGPCDGRNSTLLAETVVASPIKAVTKGDKLYVYRKVAFGRISGSYYNYYTTLEKTELVETIALNATPTWDKYQTYIATYEERDNTYYLISSTKE